ncbi:YcxB family protein [Bacillus sp. DJP31]|uniref:YcxB family protein n=1 Tax=Bacillus sp. DJP31 TaxID=3409789 RepID=UPI003BB63D1E
MKIHYEILEEDYVAFNLHHARHSETIKRSLKIQRLIGPLLFIVMPFLFARDDQLLFMIMLGMMTLLGFTWFFLFPIFMNKSIERTTRRMIKEGKNSNILGKREMTLTSEGIFDEGETNSTKSQWSTIEKFMDTDDYFFIYNSSVSAYIVPKRTFTKEEDRAEFVKFIEQSINKGA